MEDRFSTRWRIPPRVDIAVENLAEHVLSSRGVDQEAFLTPRYSLLGDPFLLPDMTVAVDHLCQVRERGGKVAIYGDYDIDGLTATALLTDALSVFGFDVISYIPDRFVEGYGLHAEALVDLKKRGVDTVVTVDCGISAAQAIKTAAKNGLHVIVTDHHSISGKEPDEAVALVNPRRSTSTYPDKDLAGVGVAFALARALQSKIAGAMPAGQEKWLLDLVALGTICDVVSLQKENRTLAYYGLKVARRSRRVGFQALAKVCGLDLGSLQAEDFGFRFGPRLNAAGRLEHAQTALDLLTADNLETAKTAADRLEGLNQQRRDMTKSIQEAAFKEAEQYADDAILVLANPHWSHGVVGLVASRVAERFGKPTIILQAENELAKGSARSVGKFSIIEALQAHEHLLERFGGHAAAAGMTLQTKNINALRTGLNHAVGAYQLELMHRELAADCWLRAEYVSNEGLDQLARLEPTGQANPRVIFFSEVEIKSLRYVGRQNQHAQLTFRIDGQIMRAIAFDAANKWPFLQDGESAALMIVLREDSWQGTRRPQLEVVAARAEVSA